MRKHILISVVVVAFVGGIFLAGPAKAASQNLIYGFLNEGAKTTSVKSTAGVPLSLYAPSGVAPLKVNQSALVANLNADKLDGLDSSAFARSSGVNADKIDGLDSTAFARSSMKTGVIVSGSARLDTDIDMYVATATCPSGTLRTGGGSYTTGIVAATSAPDGSLGWTVIGQYNALAYAVCLSPSGASIPGAVSSDVLTTFKRLARK